MKPNKNGPAWLRPNSTETAWEVVPEKAEAVRRVFELASQGNGTNAILDQLAAEGVAPIARRKERKASTAKDSWDAASINSLLKNHATYGFVRTRKAYPAIITKHQFDHVQEARKSNPGGRTREPVNLLAPLLRCGTCSTALKFRNFGKESYFECSRGCLKRVYRNNLELLVFEHVGGRVQLNVPSPSSPKGPEAKMRWTHLRSGWALVLRTLVSRIDVTDEELRVKWKSRRSTKFALR